MVLINLATVYTIIYVGNMPRYIEVHFKRSASEANLQAGTDEA